MRQQNIKQKSFRLSWPWIAIVAAAVILIVAAAWYIWLRPDRTPTPAERLQSDSVNYDPPTEDEKRESERQKEEIINEDENPPTDQSLSVTIVRTFQDPQGFNIRTVLGGTTSGECRIELSKNGQQTIAKTLPVVFEATTANCQNTPIPLSDFPAGGSWDLKITVRKDAVQSVPASTSVDIVK